MSMSEVYKGAARDFASLPMFPLFETVHYVMTAMAIREEKGSLEFARKHPLASLVAFVLCCCGGSLAVDLLLGLPLATPLLKGKALAVMVVVWYLIFHSPGDICYKFLHWQPAYIVLTIFKECRRAHSVRLGMKIAKEVYKDRRLVHIMAGMLKASGTRWAKTVEQLIRGAPTAWQHELVKPSPIFKASLLVSIVYCMQDQKLILIPQQELMLAAATFFVLLRTSTIVLHMQDPFNYIEKAVKLVLFRKLEGDDREGGEDGDDRDESEKKEQ